VAYRETIRRSSEADEVFDRQIAGKAVYARCRLRALPLEHQEANQVEFAPNLNISDQIRNTIRSGVEEGLASGVISGYPVIKVQVVIDEVQTQEDACEPTAFRIVAALALRKCLLQGNPVLLEPMMRVEITTPTEYMGDIIGDLNSRKGRVRSIEDKKEVQLLSVGVALSTMFGYLTILRSLSQGRASFSMMFDHYEEVQLH
jgi:elongation factor G